MITVIADVTDPVMRMLYGLYKCRLSSLKYRNSIAEIVNPTPYRVNKYILKSDAVFLFLHGTEDYAYYNGGYIECSEVFYDKIVVAISCSLGVNFGDCVADVGGSFIGYVQDLVFYTGKYLRDYFSIPFLEPYFRVGTGNTVLESYKRTVDRYNEVIERAPDIVRPALAYDRDSLVFLGDPYMYVEQDKTDRTPYLFLTAYGILGVLKKVFSGTLV